MTPHSSKEIYVGTAHWNIPKEYKASFSIEGSHLERYAQVFRAVEINSSFYKPHLPKTYARWANSVPDDFRFAVKIPKLITHEKRMVQIEEEWKSFFSQVSCLKNKLAVLLVQLPPKVTFDFKIASNFFRRMRGDFSEDIVCEPRHRSWFEVEADELFKDYSIGRVAADPPILQNRFLSGGSEKIIYYRLHGSPEMYSSAYPEKFLEELALKIIQQSNEGSRIWTIFDNTALGYATENAMYLRKYLNQKI